MEKITVETVAKELGVSVQSIRERMRSGEMKLGYSSVSENGVVTYVMTPKTVYEATGLKLNGYEPPIQANIDMDELADMVATKVLEKIRSKV